MPNTSNGDNLHPTLLTSIILDVLSIVSTPS
nr:MAG TPA: hypothetical protein [Caudoviricetes sp.]